MIQRRYAEVADRIAFARWGRRNGRKLLIVMLGGTGSKPVTPPL